MNIFEVMTDEEHNELSSCKKYIGKYSVEDVVFPIEITKPNCKTNVQILKHGKAFNDIRLVVLLDNINLTSKVNIWDIIKTVEIDVGGCSFDKLSGYAIDILLKKQNKSFTQFGNEIIIPIPFDIISGERLIFLDLIKHNKTRIFVEFGQKCIEKSHLIVSYYDYDEVKCHDSLLKYGFCFAVQHLNIFNQIQGPWNEEFVKTNNSDMYIKLNFNYVTSAMFFTITDNETGEIIKDKMFDECILSFDGFETVNSFISLRHKSNENNCDNGVYWLSLEGVQTYNKNYLNMNKNEYKKYPNLSNVNSITLRLKGVTDFSKKNTLSVYTVSFNCVGYSSANNNCDSCSSANNNCGNIGIIYYN
jgi:hypothetical protein